MPRRTLLYIGIAAALLVLARWATLRNATPPGATGAPRAEDPATSAAPGDATAPSAATEPPDAGPPLRRPRTSTVVLGVLTERTEEELRPLATRDAVAALVEPRDCGDDAACDVVRATLRDERATTLSVVPASDWSSGHAEVDADAGRFSPAERGAIARRPRVVVVQVGVATSPQQRALRAGFAATAAVARAVDGYVHDPLLGRVERAADFAAHTVTAPLGESAFRRDRIQLLYEPKEGGTVRVLTAGLSRWGAPDLEAARVPPMASERVAEVLLGAAQRIADGAVSGPLTLTRDDLARARGQDYPADAGLPPADPIAFDVVSVPPEPGDPNDFLARLEPPAGDGPLGYVDLAERFFGPLVAFAPPAEVLEKQRGRAQAQLAAALARWQAGDAGGAKLLVRLPFAIPGDAGFESMWIEVTHWDAQSVGGKLLDEPLGATDLARGDDVTRPRTEVEDLHWGPAR